MSACVQHPTATAQHTASSTRRALGIRHSGRAAIGSAAATTRMTAATALICLSWAGSAGLPGSGNVPPDLGVAAVEGVQQTPRRE
jgi:hypothetical protein